VESFTIPGSPNSIGHISENYGTIAEILKSYGYATFAVGKWHLSRISDRTQSGPYDQWPLGRGFDKYYGFLHGMMDQYNPDLIRDNTPVIQPKTAVEGYHVSEDFAENAIDYISNHVNTYPEQPFFLYLAFGAMHSPHHVPKEYSCRYKGKFDAGWDEIRKRWFENQKRIGIIPQNSDLTPRNEFVPSWDSLSDEEKKLYAKYMEVFAGFLTHTDEQIGKVIDYLQRLGELDNTIVVFLSDNGASAEGGQSGRFNETVSMFIKAEESDISVGLKNFEYIGTEYAHNHYPLGWANAGNTPFPWYKVFVHSGGVKDPLIIRYPAAINTPGEVREQYHHVSDVTPTILDVLGLEKPDVIKGIAQKPFTGISFKYSLNDSNAKTKKRVQYYEILGNRGIWKDGWKAIVNHTFNSSFDEDIWELYHTDADYSENHDVAKQYPKKLRELQDEWYIEAGKNNVFPMLPNTHLTPRFNAHHQIPIQHRTFKLIRKPFDINNAHSLFVGSFTINAEIDRTGDGVILSAGDRHGGFSIYVLESRLKFVFATGTREWHTIVSSETLPIGKSSIKVEFTREENSNAIVRINFNENNQGELIIPKARSMFISGNSTIGGNKFSPVSEEYDVPFDFCGEILTLTHLSS
jgi:arylsulfatase